jgi:DNA modification methylase
MIFLDPPYFEWKDRTLRHGDAKIAQSGIKPDHDELSKLTFQLIKPCGAVWLCGTQPQLIEDWQYWKRYFRLVAEVIQYKTVGTPPVSPHHPIRVHENIWLMFRKDQKISESKIDIRRAAKNEGKTIRRTDTNAMRIRDGEWKQRKEEVGYPKSVMEVQKIDSLSKEYVGHPTQKPLEMMRTIVKMSTEEGDLVLDPFAGSGTTLIACKELNRRCLGIEINRQYCRMIKDRMRKVRLDMFL